MTIINKTSYPHWLERGPAPRKWMGEDWAEVPPELEDEVWDCLGYCDIVLGDLVIPAPTEDDPEATETIKDGLVVSIMARKPPKPPKPEPTAEERMTALEEAIIALVGADEEVTADVKQKAN